MIKLPVTAAKFIPALNARTSITIIVNCTTDYFLILKDPYRCQHYTFGTAADTTTKSFEGWVKSYIDK
jgi:hypothetical protein